MKVYLVIDDSKNKLLFCKEQYQLFLDLPKALEAAKKAGFEDNFICVTDQVGVKSVYCCGDTNISILPLEVQ